MGHVFLAEDSKLRRQVALKRLPTHSDANPDAKERFLREAQAAARLNHPNICTIFDAGEDETGVLFISMEYVSGGSLADARERAALPPEELIEVAIQVAQGLAEAHAHGIIHRDLKPSNLMRTERGEVKIVDFGVAKWTERVTPDSGEETTLRWSTETGTIVGTVPYLSPEQAFGRDVDARSDIFSLGTVLYQLASGRLPFTGESAVEIIAAIAHTEPAPLDTAQIGEPIDRLIARCLRKRPEDRFASVTELLAELRRIRDGQFVSSPGPPHNIPRSLATFVGREPELAELSALIDSNRLVTVTGAGGSGKSTLAREAALRKMECFVDGVRLVDLAPIASPEMVAAAFADALGVKEAAGQDLRSSVEIALVGKQLLLLVDNCEHLVDETAAVVESLLRSKSELTVIATSREALNVPGEQVWAIPLLSRPSSRAGITAATALGYDSVRLFTERAMASDFRFRLDESNLDAVLTICDRLDGMPLAIELAAARVRAMPVTEIRNRLDDCFRILTTKARGVLPRHQTLRGAIDWSFELLETPERILFESLAVFAAGFSLEAVEAVSGFGAVTREEVLQHLSRLVDKSLVVSDGTQGDTVRYRLLEPIRQFAAERLGDLTDLFARRHFEHYVAIADRAYADRVASSAAWLQSLEMERPQFRAALAWSARCDRAAHLRLAGALAWFWHLHSHFTEGRRELRTALDGAVGRTAHEARALGGASALASLQGDHDEARTAAKRSLAIWRELGEPLEIAMALESMGWNLWYAGEDAPALRAFEEGLAIHRRAGDAKLVNRAVLNVCQVLVGLHEVETAEPMAREALATALAQKELRDIHFASHFLADCALIRDDFVEAEKRYGESLRAAVDYGDRLEMIFEVQGIAMSVGGQGREAKALRLAGAAEAEIEALHANITVPFWVKLLDRHLGAVTQRSDPATAEVLRAEGRELGFDAAIPYALDSHAS